MLVLARCDCCQATRSVELIDEEGQWASRVCSALQLRTLGRMLFSAVLMRIRQEYACDPFAAALRMEALAKEIGLWKPASGGEEVERQLLLKELRIGRRAVVLVTWSGHVSAAHARGEEGLSLAPPQVEVRLRIGNGHIVAKVSIVKVDLWEHSRLVEVPEDLRCLRESLRELMINRYELNQLPEWLGELRCLEVLSVAGEPFKRCPLLKLPESLGKLSMLRILDLSCAAEGIAGVGGGTDGAADSGSVSLLRAEGIAGVGGEADGGADSGSDMLLGAGGIAMVGEGDDGAADSESVTMQRAEGIAGVSGGADGAADSESDMLLGAGRHCRSRWGH